jgi:hypothetical protein
LASLCQLAEAPPLPDYWSPALVIVIIGHASRQEEGKRGERNVKEQFFHFKNTGANRSLPKTTFFQPLFNPAGAAFFRAMLAVFARLTRCAVVVACAFAGK